MSLDALLQEEEIWPGQRLHRGRCVPCRMVSMFDTIVLPFRRSCSMSGRNFSLTPHLSAFVDRQVASGQHQNASEVVREALRRYEADIAFSEAQLAEITAIAERGRTDIERGRYVTISTPEDAAALRRRVKKRTLEILGVNEERDEIPAAKP